MENNIKEVVGTLLAARQYVYSLFHTLLGTEPTAEILAAASSKESLQTVALFDSEDSGAAKALTAALTRAQGLDAAGVDSIRMEYTRLFLGPEDLPAPPWESVYMTKERAIFQESMLVVRGWFQKYGYLPAGYPNYPDDHVSLLTHFIALTSELAAAHLEAGDMDKLCEVLRDQQSFIQHHMLNWFSRYAEDMGKSETDLFYPALARAMADFAAADAGLLDEMLACVA
ncbi:MAG: molecular chaperone TorD family protein [Clostridia bacterium]|nr:molecular chaperone TorD family protein [Clostridia bacterium]MBP3428790.1 molecular chaperone TorD family protein [Clostridia bacterium]